MTVRSIAIRLRAAAKVLTSVSTYSSLFGIIREGYSGAWQQNVVIDHSPSTLLAFSAVYACVTGIASDIAKMRIKLTRNVDGIWEEIVTSHGNDKTQPILKLLRKPNRFQNYIQFTINWILSKLLYGNTYVLKERDSDRNVIAMYILHPACVTPLVATDGSVYYALSEDYLAQVESGKTVPASEIIHDRMPELWHPLVGVSPLYACAMSVTMGNKIQSNSAAFFANSSRPGGILTAPTEISDETALRLKTAFETNYGGVNAGRIAVLGNSLKFEALREAAEQSQLIEQLKWTVEDVGRAFHYPSFKLGGSLPPYAGNVDPLIITCYYTDCLQFLIESMELCLDEGLALPIDMGTELDVESLLRMDTGALFKSINDASDWMKLNEQRKRANLPALPIGGDTVYKQEQDHSIEALAKRDALADPFASKTPAVAPPAVPSEPTPANRSAIDDGERPSLEEEILSMVAEFEEELVSTP